MAWQLFGTSVRSVADRGDGVEVTTTRGLVLRADLLVGADGVHSRVRRLAFGPEQDYLRYLGFHTAAFTWRRLAPLLGFPAEPGDPRWPAMAGAVRAIVFTPHRR